ncbi:hypothetical protein [Ferruginibacter sp.]
MDKKIILIYLFTIIFVTGFSQDKSKSDSSIFAKGIHLENFDYTFPWIFYMKEITEKGFKNLNIIKKNRLRVNIKFDSAIFLNGILLDKVVIAGIKKKDEDKYEIIEFRSIVDTDGLERVAKYFNYKWKGWKTIRGDSPYYQMLLQKNKKYNYIIIRKFSL